MILPIKTIITIYNSKKFEKKMRKYIKKKMKNKKANKKYIAVFASISKIIKIGWYFIILYKTKVIAKSFIVNKTILCKNFRRNKIMCIITCLNGFLSAI